MAPSDVDGIVHSTIHRDASTKLPLFPGLRLSGQTPDTRQGVHCERLFFALTEDPAKKGVAWHLRCTKCNAVFGQEL